MAIDASIPLGVQPMEVPSPVNAFAKMQQLQGMQQQNAINALALQERQRAIADEANLNRIHGQSYDEQGKLDRNKLISGMARANLASKIPATQKLFNELDRAELETQKLNLENTAKVVGGIASILQGTKTQDEYDARIRLIAERFGQDVAGRLPKFFNPLEIQRRTQEALSVSEQAQQRQREIDHQLNLDKFIWQKSFDSDKFDWQKINDIANRNVTMRGQNLTDARAQQSNYINLEKLKLDQQEAANKPNSAENRAREEKISTVLLNEAARIIPKSTGSLAGKKRDEFLQNFGISTTGAQNIAKLKVIESQLIFFMPKLSGPQSDRDVQLYREAAGKIGDPEVPTQTRLAAVQTIKQIKSRYPDADWSFLSTNPNQNSNREVDFGEMK